MKKHFILLGKPGLIYYCWLFIILFIGLIIAYETTKKFSWPSCIIIVLFVVLFVFSFWHSYYTQEQFVLPYRFRLKIKDAKVSIHWSWKSFRIGEIKVDRLHRYWIFYIEHKKSLEK